jgi:hypothetical protein
MVVGVVFAGFLRMMHRVDMMAVGHMSVVTGFVVVPRFMVLGCGEMMLRGVFVMFGCFLVMFSALFRHV